MCGISGIYTFNSDDALLSCIDQMTTALHHRGPDNTGTFVDPKNGIAFGHNRLSIIDLSELGSQPMRSEKTEDVLNFNGEIYNYKNVRRELQELGYDFKSESDSEVLMHAFAEWGSNCLHQLKGMYAFSYWKASNEKLFLVRDPMGIKPLYYWILPDKKGIVFASEVKAFLELPRFTKSLNRASLNQYLEFGYTYDKTCTIFQGLKKLPPGHIMEIERNGKVNTTRYFNPEIISKKDKSRESLEDELYHSLQEVIQEQLVSDVPVGLLLSGGLDSSIVASIASQQKKIRTFSFGFSNSEIDERKKARTVSDFIGSEHEEFEITPKEIIGDIDRTIAHMDDLFSDWGVFSTRLMYQKCRKRGVKVVLVGEGADELFGGYWGRFKPSLDGDQDWKIDWRLFQMYRVYIARRYGKGFIRYRKIMRNYLKQSNGDLFDAIRLFESREQLSNNFVMKVDKASMAESVEARVPFLDSRIAEIAYRIPRDYLIAENNVTKSLLVSMAKRYKLLPEETLDQPKFGISVPAQWMDESELFQQNARKILLEKNSWVDRLGFGKAMDQYLNMGRLGFPFPSALSLFRNLAWKLLLLGLWFRYYGVEPDSDHPGS